MFVHYVFVSPCLSVFCLVCFCSVTALLQAWHLNVGPMLDRMLVGSAYMCSHVW